MAVTLVASSTSAGAGTTGTGTADCPAPALPTGTAVGDRVYLATSSVGQPTAPSGWTELFNGQLGGGTMGASTGLRYGGVWYRDYDGVWSMPIVTAASAAANTIVGGAMTLTKSAGEAWATPSATSGSDTTSDTSLSITSGTSQTLVTNGALWVAHFLPATPGTTTSIVITSANATLSGTVTLAPAITNNTTGNDATFVARHLAVTSGGTGAQTFTATLTTARTSGAVFVSQAVVLIRTQLTVANPAVNRAATR